MNLVKTSGEIENHILTIRGQRVILDVDLAKLYAVTTKRLNEQIKRNKDKFPEDFIFRLTKNEKEEVVANCDHLAQLKFSRITPYAFTEHGVIMAANVLNSVRAIEISILVVRTFIHLRQIPLIHKALRSKLSDLELRLNDHDGAIRNLVKVINQMVGQEIKEQKRSIGFASWEGCGVG